MRGECSSESPRRGVYTPNQFADDRKRRAALPGPSPAHAQTGLERALHQLVGQSSFTDARLTDDPNQSTTARESALQCALERGELSLSTHEPVHDRRFYAGTNRVLLGLVRP